MYKLIRPLLFSLDAEHAHRWGLRSARLGQAVGMKALKAMYEYEHDALKIKRFGMAFSNPVGLAAGFDKNARLPAFWKALGFGFAEVGSVTARPSEGNPHPRAFRLPEDRAIINRMGLNNEGAEAVAERLKADDHAELPLGINIAKTHDPDIMGEAAVEDFRRGFRLLAPLAGYVALNISCPNTREGKTFESPSALRALLEAIHRENESVGVPVLLKLSPPLSDHVVYDSAMHAIIELAREYEVDGFIAANTAKDRAGLLTPAETVEEMGPGGLSGVPLARRTTRLIRHLYRATDGELPIIGVGGIDSARAAYEKIRAGASLVQIYTGLIYEGPGLVKEIKKNLARLVLADGYGRLEDAVGVDARQTTHA